MCGICGYIGKKRIEDHVLIKMRDTLSHRGPDDKGDWQGSYTEGFIGLAHRRLSIFDLSEAGHQPMHSIDGRVSLVFNGEIYNFIALREELSQKGYQFGSDCDTEVILAAYLVWGETCFARFNGMFAVAIWDRKEKTFILARDRMGVKPLYYWMDSSNQMLLFASELKAIMQYSGFPRRIRKEMIGSFLCNKYISSPDTIFTDTYKVVPGTYLIYKNGEVRSHSFWDIIQEKETASLRMIPSQEDCLKELDRIITDAIKLRLAADVPVGTFLSSGIDSTLITSIAASISSQPVKTFTIGFYDKGRNEANEAAAIARYLGTDHTQVYISENEIFEMIKDLPYYYDEPFSDPSQLPTMLLSRITSDQVTVALSGDGGDELFCGYEKYDWIYWAQKLDWIGEMACHLPGMNTEKKWLSPEVQAFIHNRESTMKTQFSTDARIGVVESILDHNVENAKFRLEKRLPYKNWQERRMVLDMMTYLPDDIMTKTDRASMKYSLEVRSPLLDYRVVETSFRIPHRFKYHRFEKKDILKRLAYQYVPKSLLTNKKKGFGVPLKKWLRTLLKAEITSYAEEDRIRKQEIFDPVGIRTLIEKQDHSDKVIYSSVLWSFYVFQRWYEEFFTSASS